MIKFSFLVCIFIVKIGCLNSVAQSLEQDSTTKYSVSTISGIANGKMPWWLHVNQMGVIQEESSNAFMRYEYEKTGELGRYFDYTLIADAVTRISKNSRLFFPQLAIKLSNKLGSIELGRFQDPIGLNEELMGDVTFGSMMVSNNATQPYKVSIKTSGFNNVPFTAGFLKWRGSFSQGWFGPDRMVKNSLLHEKTFYLNLDLWIFQGYGGFVHNIVYGGNHPTEGNLNVSIENYMRMILGLGAKTNSKLPEIDKGNTIGNSVAAYDYGLTLDITKSIRLSAYRIFYIEDSPGLFYRNPWDGVWGSSLTLPQNITGITKFGHEFIYTIRQGQIKQEPPEPIGADNYYNHSYFIDGWTSYGRVLGVPLLLTSPKDGSSFFNPNKDPITNNILIGHHAFIKGEIKNLNYTFHVIYSRNYGTFRDLELIGYPYSRNQIKKEELYVALQTIYKLNSTYNIDLVTSLAADFGKLYSNRMGLLVGLKFNQPDTFFSN